MYSVYKPQTELTAKMSADFVALLDEYYSLPEVWNNELDRQLHEWYANVSNVWPKRPYFSPSSVNSCLRELYLKDKGAKRDNFRRQPHQGRWQRMGTVTGDFIQRDLLNIEDKFEQLTGNVPPFKFYRTRDGLPTFEDFIKTNSKVNIEGVEYYLYGLPDGVMEYVTDDGEKIRVGLEIKTKQTTPARTSLYSMRDAEQSHFDQTVAYSYMYKFDYVIILYVNAAKQRWVVTDEEYEKTPDIRAFAYEITDEDRYEVLSRLADVRKAVINDKPPKMDITKWTFNNYKQATAKSLTDEELAEVREYVGKVDASNAPQYEKAQLREALEQLEELRGGK